MEIIAIINQKGGTGKTTTTVNLGAALSKLGKKVLMIDLDSQASLTYYLGIKDFSYTISDLFLGKATLTESMVAAEGMFLIPATIDLADTALNLVKKENRLHRLEEILKDVHDFDFVLLDCPPSLSIITVNALIAARKVIIPTQLEVLSVHGIGLILQTIQKISDYLEEPVWVLGVVLTNVREQFEVYLEIKDFIYRNFDVRVFNSQIKTCEKIIESPSFAKSVIHYSPYSIGAKSYLNLARELVLILSKKLFQKYE